MTRVFVERRQLIKDLTLTWDLSHHLYTRYTYGVTVIVSDRPHVLLAALRRQWLKVIMKVRNEYSRTLSTARKLEIEDVVAAMEKLPFIADLPPSSQALPAVYIISENQIGELSGQFRTIYATSAAQKTDLPSPIIREALKPHLVHHGVLVEYFQGEVKR
ncbi:MAG TPA: hypothetical protein VLF62_00420 [Candidatus Saccharimonadales bacterium]|nr:hypothetical protein [Candidatus Saccharimonadales bacterium]